MKATVERFKRHGAPTVSATVIDRSLPFWERVGFKRTKVFLVGNWQ